MNESLDSVTRPTGRGTGPRCIGLHPDDPSQACPARATWDVVTACDYGHDKSGPACSAHKEMLERGLADDAAQHPLRLLFATPL